MAFQLDIDENEHNASMMKKLDNMRNERRHSDLTIKVGNEEFPVHRNIMSAGSDYFDAMLSHDNLETKTGIVNMKEVDVDSVKLCIDYIYTGKASITLEKCEQLLHVANILQLKVLCKKIGEYLNALCLNSKSFYVVKNIATVFSDESLKESCDNYALSNLGAILQEEEFKQLDKEYISFLTGPKNVLYSEDSKLSSILKWIKFDSVNRQQYLIEMLKQLKGHKISSSYIKYLTENEKLCLKSAECMKHFVMIVVRGTKSKPADMSHLAPPLTLVCFDTSSNSLRSFNHSQKKWTDFCKIEKSKLSGSYTAAVLHEYLYLLKQDCKAFRINVTKEKPSWNEIPNLLQNHGAHITTTNHRNFIYVGGMKSIERFNPGIHEWNEIQMDGAVRTEYTLVGCNDFIYSLGGINEDAVNTVTRYCSASSSWSLVEPMRFSRRTPAAEIYNNLIFAAGGWSGNERVAHVECFDPGANTWTTLKSMITPRTRFKLIRVENELFAVGGDASSTRTMEKYDLKEKIWTKVVTLSGININSQATVAVQITK